jgi:FKBP-type peptidyl-prolyl cis-trans isomerase FkpA
VVVSVSARMPDGTAVESIKLARAPMKLNALIPGLREGIGLLKVGGKALIYVPPALAFPPQDWPASIPRGAPIVFFVELHDVRP